MGWVLPFSLGMWPGIQASTPINGGAVCRSQRASHDGSVQAVGVGEAKEKRGVNCRG